MTNAWRRAMEALLSIGTYPDESPNQRTRRRIFVGAATIASILAIPFALSNADRGYTLVAASLLIVMITTPTPMRAWAMSEVDVGTS